MTGSFSNPSSLSQKITFQPWIFFGFFLISHSLLSYAHLPLTIKIWILIFGLILPLLLAGWAIKESPSSDLSAPSPTLPIGIGVVFLALLLFSRFYQLTSLPFWPIADEGFEGMAGISLLDHWSGRLLWSPIPHEPLLDWLLAFYFKISAPSLFSFRLFSTLISLTTVITAYWAARAFLSRRNAFVFTWLLASSYWALTLSRLCIVVILIPWFMCFSFGCLGRLMSAVTTRSRCWFTAGLIAGNILGFYSWTNWIGPAVGLTLILMVHTWRQPSFSKFYALVFALVSAVAIVPIVLARSEPGEMNYIHHLLDLDLWDSAKANLIGLFWDGSVSFPYGSLLGGFLNSVLDALAFLGAVYFFQAVRSFWRWVIPIVVLVSLAPALFAANIELYRTLPFMVFLTAAATLGVQCLLADRDKLKFSAVLVILLISSGIDSFNYFHDYCDYRTAPVKQQWRTSAYAHAYHILDDLQHRSGPLYFFSNFSTDYDNRTMEVACYPFNVLENPRLTQAQPEWITLLTDVNYAPYLLKVYPHTRFVLLKMPDDPSDSQNFIALFVIPRSDMDTAKLKRWISSYQLYDQINLEFLNKNPMTPWSDLADALRHSNLDLGHDPFLTSLYWERMGFFDLSSDKDSSALEDYRTAVTQGYPARQLYYGWALALKNLGRANEANKVLTHLH